MLEQRYTQASELRIEERADGEGLPEIRGYAIVFDTLSTVIWGSFRERIAAGAFSDSVAAGDVRGLWAHDPTRVLARQSAGTLDLWEDDRGVAFAMRPADTQVGRDAVTSIGRGDVTGMSFGFTVLPDGSQWSEDPNGELIRTVTNGTLFEVSPVAWPAYTETDASIRSIDGLVVSDIFGVKPNLPSVPRARADDIEQAAQARRRELRELQLSLLT